MAYRVFNGGASSPSSRTAAAPQRLDEDVAVLICGAPPVQAGAEFFDDPEP